MWVGKLWQALSILFNHWLFKPVRPHDLNCVSNQILFLVGDADDLDGMDDDKENKSG